MVDVNKMQELDPALVAAQYGKRTELGPEEKAAAVAFKQVTLLSSARTAVYFNLALEAVRKMDASEETIETLEAVVKVCEDSMTDPQAKEIYEKAMLVATQDASVNLMITAISVNKKLAREEALRKVAAEEKQTSLDFHPQDHHDDMA